MTHENFIFNARILGFNLQYLITNGTLFLLYENNLHRYLKQFPVLPNNLCITSKYSTIEFNLNNQVLPVNLTINANCKLYVNNQVLPKNLKVQGHLYIIGDCIIPNDIIIMQDLNISKSNINYIPSNIIINNDLMCSSLLPENEFTVLGNLYTDEPKMYENTNIQCLGQVYSRNINGDKEIEK